MPGVPNAVFLSYASEDAEPAERIATALRAAGVEVWFDKSELRDVATGMRVGGTRNPAALKTDPLLDPLRQEPRFQAVMRELKFPIGLSGNDNLAPEPVKRGASWAALRRSVGREGPHSLRLESIGLRADFDLLQSQVR